MTLPRMTSVFLVEATEHAWTNLGFGSVGREELEIRFQDRAYDMGIVIAGMFRPEFRADDAIGLAMHDIATTQEESRELNHRFNAVRTHAKLRSELRRNSARLAQLGGTPAGDQALRELFAEYPLTEPAGYSAPEVLVDLGDGWKWVAVGDKECQGYEGELMQHCGNASNDMYSLRDAHGKPHATAELNFNRCAMRQLKGKQNDMLDQKYWTPVGTLLTHLRTKTGKYWQFDDPMYLNSQEGTDFLEYLDRNKLAWDGWDKNKRFGKAVPAREFFGPDFPEEDL